MTFHLDSYDIVEVVRPIDSGMTQPFLCYLADDQLYAVKGREALPRGLMAELIAGALGRFMGLPIPDFAVAELSRDLASRNTNEHVQTSLNVGSNFASLWQEPVEAVTMPLLRTYPKELLARIFVFDHWIMNGDRTLSEHGGNPNLLVKLENKSLIAIDHNLAFSPGYSPDELANHACRGAWLAMSRDPSFVSRCGTEMSSALNNLDAVIQSIPEEWLEENEEFPAHVKSMLIRFEEPSFWEHLR